VGGSPALQLIVRSIGMHDIYDLAAVNDPCMAAACMINNEHAQRLEALGFLDEDDGDGCTCVMSW
jgi:hypothetical protein